MQCNMALGYANDDVQQLRKAIDYLAAGGYWTETQAVMCEQAGEQNYFAAWRKIVGERGVCRHKNKQKKYGLAMAASWWIFEHRGIQSCQLCEESFDFDHPQGLGLLSPVVDHVTVGSETRIRGIIHQRCNGLLGQLRDDVMRATRLLEYLERSELEPLESRHRGLLDAYLQSFSDIGEAMRSC